MKQKNFKKDDLAKAITSIASMISKIKKAQTHFAKGTSQHALAKNRLKALRLAMSLMKKSQKGRRAKNPRINLGP